MGDTLPHFTINYSRINISNLMKYIGTLLNIPRLRSQTLDIVFVARVTVVKLKKNKYIPAKSVIFWSVHV